MFISEHIIAFIFRFINLAVVVWLFWYLLKRYGLSMLREKMLEHKRIFTNMRSKKNLLRQEQLDLRTAIVEQGIKAKILQKKVEFWRKTFRELCQLREQEKKFIVRMIIQKKKLQTEHLALRRVQEQVIPVALERMRADLTTEFSQEGVGQTFIQQLVERMKK